MSPQCEFDMSAHTPVSSVVCFTSFLPDFTPGPSDEKNGQLSRQPSTPSRQNSRRSESGSERERGEKERAADGGSSSGSSSGTVLQRRGSGKDKTRLLSSSNGTQSHPWKECCGRETRVIRLAFFSSFPQSFPHSIPFPYFLPCFLPLLQSNGISEGKYFVEADLGIWQRTPHKGWFQQKCILEEEAGWADL